MTDVAERPAHSPLGASGAERWLNCPGSVTLLKELALDESDEPDYRREGTAAHEAAAKALTDGLDAWELVGEEFFGLKIGPELADPIQTYLDHCRQFAKPYFIEYGVSSPRHPQFYGTADFVAAGSDGLTVVDLKMGQGIMVDVEDNPQLKYYAFGVIEGLERSGTGIFKDQHPVILTIVQPRGHLEPVRSWETTAGEIKEWTHDVLLPAMYAAEYEDRLTPGDWCRFCPAKLVCPLLTALFKAAATANPKHIPDLSDFAIGTNYVLAQAVKHYTKALETEAFNRAMLAKDIPGTKLVHKKGNRVWKDGAADTAKAKFGDDAFSAPEFKSPAELEKLPAARDWVKEFSYTPETGLTLALESDSRRAVKATPPTERFAGVAAAAEDW